MEEIILASTLNIFTLPSVRAQKVLFAQYSALKHYILYRTLYILSYYFTTNLKLTIS